MPDALIDAWLLKHFPGKTLEELDKMDWPRFMRAMEASGMCDLELKKEALAKGFLKSNSITRREFEKMKENDDLYSALEEEGE